MLFAPVYLAFALILFASTLGAMRATIFGRGLAPVTSFAGMFLVFFIPQFIVLGFGVTAIAYLVGALEYASGRAGLIIHLVSWALLSIYLIRMHRALPELDGAIVRDRDHPFCDGMTDDELTQLRPGQISWRPSLTYRIPAMLAVDVTRSVVFREIGSVRLKLDVYRPKRHSEPRPCVLYIHGGGWVMGNRRQSHFMLYELAAAGFVVFAVSYRFAPRFPMPAAIEDCKAAVAWIREHASEHGGIASQLMVIGGSAGGHLAAMVALTPNERRFQPGFEQADTRVQGAVVLYGVSDIAGAFEAGGHPVLARLLERWVFKARFRESPELFHATSPMTYPSASAPPMLLAHGRSDHVVPLAQSIRLAAKLRDAGARRVHVMEVPLGQHAFEVFPSPLHQRTVRIIVRFLESVRRDTQREAATG